MSNIDVDVVVIDSGCSIRNNRIIGGVKIDENGIISDYSDLTGHGSTVCSVILEENPKCTVYCIKIFDSYEKGISQGLLLSALKYVIDNIDCKIINLSLGVLRIDNYIEWRKIISALNEKNIIIVSAFNNDGAISYPAAFEDVIGVDEEIANFGINGGYLYFKYNTIVNLILSKRSYRAIDHNGNRIIVYGSSFACAYITGFLSKKIEKSDHIMIDTKKELEDNAKLVNTNPFNKDLNYYRFKEKLKLLKNAVVFPFNKEIHSIACFENFLKVNVSDYFDHNISVNKNKKIKEVLKHSNNEKTIKGINSLDWKSDFDLLICGHCREMELITNTHILKELIEKCVEYRKHMYSFDDISSEIDSLNEEDKSLFFYPSVSMNSLSNNQIGKLRQTSLPVVGVFGTSSVQGKYFLQIKIRESLINRGIKVGQISTEPSGYLFGMDYVYPMGYNSSVYINRENSVTLLNEIIWEIEKERPDILIVGSQSGTIPYAFYNLNNLTFPQVELLFGTCPDAVLLCINLYDPIDYIIKTIRYIEAFNDTKVIGMIISPVSDRKRIFGIINTLDISSKSKDDFCNRLTKETNINVYNHEDVDEITNLIISYFS